MRKAKPSLVDAFLAVLLLAGILAVALGVSRVQTGGVVAIVLALGVAVAIRPWQRPERARRGASRRRLGPERACPGAGRRAQGRSARPGASRRA